MKVNALIPDGPVAGALGGAAPPWCESWLKPTPPSELDLNQWDLDVLAGLSEIRTSNRYESISSILRLRKRGYDV